MTREEAIDRLTYLMSDLNEFCNESKHMSDNDRKEMESLDMAIKALKKEPCEDAVSRKAVLDMAKSYNTDGYDSYTPLVVDVEDIEELPSVTSTRPKAQWIRVHYIDGNNDTVMNKCSNCQTEFGWDIETGISFEYYLYCPNCGAYMRGSEDGSN